MPDANASQMWMQNLRSLNFEPLRAVFPDLANMGGYAEHYAHTDPESSLVKLRNFAERVVDHIYLAQKLVRAPQSNFVDLLSNSSFRMVATDLVLDKLHLLRKLGNRAAHGEGVQAADAVRCVREAWQLARWLHVTFLAGKPADFVEFKNPPAEGIDSKAEIKRKAKALAEENALKEERLKQALQELADLRAAEKAAKPTAQPQADPPPEVLALQEQASASVAAQLHFTEDNTRKWLIDRDLRLAGWDVPAGTASNDSVGQEVEVLHQPTASTVGYCDYVLWDDNGKPLAVVEAKKTTVDARQGQRQAELYADGLEKMHGQRPMIFFTNGHDIWLWDDAAGYPPRSVYGFMSKDSLQYRVGFQRRERLDLAKVRPDPVIAGRLYQIESITRVAERFTARHRKALVVQATGTGKTRVAISLAKLLIEARWAKRVLFLCDRKELRKQAKNAFNDFLDEPLYVIGQANDIGKLDARIYVGIYQGLINDYEDFDVGFFDLVIADESHRSIYNLYGDLFKYFDALQIGLTATPVEMVSRSTCHLFGCDYKLPTANYPLEQAIADRNLVPFKVVAHTTKFLRDGIKAKHLTDEQIASLEDQGIDPNTLEFDAKEIDDAVFNKDTNRIILRNLMDNGIRDAEGQLPGKTIVFARNIDHARLLSGLFDEMYPQFAGKLCRVIHSQEPRAEDLIDQFKSNNELRIAISVDMLDTGIDVPEVVNLVFAKPVKSKVKFWQMIGRGTRLCKNLFGRGLDKTEFLIFDHWGNFAFHDLNAEEIEPSIAKPLTQRRYEARIDLAARALARSDIPAFDALAVLLQKDAAALPDGAIAVRERWQAVQQARDAKLLHQFAPVTRQILTESVAPLMSSLDVRGQGDALRWDLLLCKAQAAAIEAPALANPHRADVVAWLDRLPPHLNPVRAKAAELKALRSDAFWQASDFATLDSMREALRAVIHLAEPPSPPPPPPLVTRLDIREDTADIEVTIRQTRIKSVDYGIYRKAVQSVLEPLFDTDPVLKKIRRGEPVTDEELDRLNSLLHTLNPDVNLATLREFFPDTAVPLAHILRSIVGHDHEAVEARFTAFAQTHALNSQQLRFLALLKEHIRQYGALTPDKLFEAPFTTVHAEGLGGIFPNDKQLDEVVRLVRSFGEPIVVPLTT
jgi:type I restriction enzyme, R subunit